MTQIPMMSVLKIFGSLVSDSTPKYPGFFNWTPKFSSLSHHCCGTDIFDRPRFSVIYFELRNSFSLHVGVNTLHLLIL